MILREGAEGDDSLSFFFAYHLRLFLLRCSLSAVGKNAPISFLGKNGLKGFRIFLEGEKRL